MLVCCARIHDKQEQLFQSVFEAAWPVVMSVCASHKVQLILGVSTVVVSLER